VPGTTLLLAGAGPEHARLAALARADGVADAVLLPGRMDARDALAAADVVAVPSSMEGLSVLALEAQAAGLPVAASDVGGLPEAIEHEGSGLLVAPGSLPAWTEALARLLGDGALRAALGEAGRARARERFDIRDMAAKTVALYERLGGALSR
jgi:glycosyltransferase involved in cell wall biosynthesis